MVDRLSSLNVDKVTSLAVRTKTYNPRSVRPLFWRRFRGRVNAGRGPVLPMQWVEDGFNFVSDRIRRMSQRGGQQKNGIEKYAGDINQGVYGVGWRAIAEGGNVWVDTFRRTKDQVSIGDAVVTPYIPDLQPDYDPGPDIPPFEFIEPDFSTPDLPPTGYTIPRPDPDGGAFATGYEPPDRPWEYEWVCETYLDELDSKELEQPVTRYMEYSRSVFTTICIDDLRGEPDPEAVLETLAASIAAGLPSGPFPELGPSSAVVEATNDGPCGIGNTSWSLSVGHVRWEKVFPKFCYQLLYYGNEGDVVVAVVQFADGSTGPGTRMVVDKDETVFNSYKVCQSSEDATRMLRGGPDSSGKEYAGVKFYKEKRRCYQRKVTR